MVSEVSQSQAEKLAGINVIWRSLDEWLILW